MADIVVNSIFADVLMFDQHAPKWYNIHLNTCLSFAIHCMIHWPKKLGRSSQGDSECKQHIDMIQISSSISYYGDIFINIFAICCVLIFFCTIYLQFLMFRMF